ncbi:hypothetical protein M9H77_35474 [Catharanthus roseus]|uniref:Uncharacterized protein n=1 Tax=Catharanthus roseus TaxID=4058 RepID=A0ACB9ZQU3_CATRO|nr:hypothetical protein M9H77_35474 [Catharanthus roseus]
MSRDANVEKEADKKSDGQAIVHESVGQKEVEVDAIRIVDGANIEKEEAVKDKEGDHLVMDTNEGKEGQDLVMETDDKKDVDEEKVSEDLLQELSIEKDDNDKKQGGHLVEEAEVQHNPTKRQEDAEVLDN